MLFDDNDYYDHIFGPDDNNNDFNFNFEDFISNQPINENIDTLVSEILNYAKKIDEILKSVDIESSYLDMVSNLNSTNEIVLKEDINDEKVKENVEDLIKRINTRINLIHSNDKVLKELTEKYDIDNINLEEEIKNANLI